MATFFIPVAVPISAQADTGSSGDQSCAWLAELSPRTVGELNVAYPDTNAWYWIMPYDVGPHTTLTIKGRFPHARYMSFNTYDNKRNSFTNDAASALPDYAITPDSGSINPWQQAGATGGQYTVTVRPDAHAGDPNVLPLAPAGVSSGKGYLIYRMYMTTQAPGPADLPQVTVTTDGAARNYGSCVVSSHNGLTAQVLEAGQGVAGFVPGATAGPDFVRRGANGSFPNGDNAYLLATVSRPADGKVLVIRAKAPTAPESNEPSVWPQPGQDVRYFSLCNNVNSVLEPVVYNTLPDGSTDLGCRADNVTKLDANGYYTYVLATEAQRAAVEAIPNATFVPWSVQHPDSPHLVILRNMLPSSDFSAAIQRVGLNTGPADAAATLGEYYPHYTVCDLPAVTAGTCAP
ncbi:hypothetical protein ACIRRA_43465 [Nocardia sp. NPDC101769]|uniref:hypothetical protein n=1 Tax=Nocardia sp. NPDC101769 TaxID=3364333 RepID=UPI00381F0BA7